MELQSTYLQHIYRAAGSIATDSVVRAKAKSLFFTTVASKQQQFPDLPRLTPDVVYDNNTWNQEVDTSYQDLIACQSELEQRCDISLPQKESDVDQYIRDFVAIVHDVVDGRPAAQCLTLAEMLLESEGPQLLEDNYFLDDRPPMVIPLDGGFGLLNKVLLDQLWALMYESGRFRSAFYKCLHKHFAIPFKGISANCLRPVIPVEDRFVICSAKLHRFLFDRCLSFRWLIPKPCDQFVRLNVVADQLSALALQCRSSGFDKECLNFS
jgi:hypothetical protein